MLRRWLPVIVLIAFVAPPFLAWPAQAQDRSRSAAKEPSTAIPKKWDTFSAEVTIRHGRIPAVEGAVQISAPESRFRLERSRAGDGWKTVLTVLARGRITGRPGSAGIDDRMSAAQVGMRIEDAGDGRPLRIFDRVGKPLQVPNPNEIRRLLGASAPLPEPALTSAAILGAEPPPVRMGAGPDWATGVVFPAGGRELRLQALAERYGPPRARVKGLDRYTAVRERGESEVLIDPATALPVESNVTENGQLVSHASYEYAPYGSQSVVRNRIRFEQLAPGGPGDRTVATIELSDVRFSQRGVAK